MLRNRLATARYLKPEGAVFSSKERPFRLPLTHVDQVILSLNTFSISRWPDGGKRRLSLVAQQIHLSVCWVEPWIKIEISRYWLGVPMVEPPESVPEGGRHPTPMYFIRKNASHKLATAVSVVCGRSASPISI